MRNIVPVLAAAAAIAIGSAQAQTVQLDPCAPPDQHLAAQVLKLHTEMMVVSLTCINEHNDPELSQKYSKFMTTNTPLIMRSQAMLIEALNGSANFDTWWTELSNAEQMKVRQFTIPAYCEMHEPQFRDVVNAPPDRFERYAQNVSKRNRFYACELKRGS